MQNGYQSNQRIKKSADAKEVEDKNKITTLHCNRNKTIHRMYYMQNIVFDSYSVGK